MPHNKPCWCEVLKKSPSTFLENVLEINSSKGEYFRLINPPKTKPLVVLASLSRVNSVKKFSVEQCFFICFQANNRAC